MTRAAATLALLILGACGHDEPQDDTLDGGPSSDAGPEPDASPELVVAAPTPPAAAALPTLTPCPAGWREVVDPGVPGLVTCAPWPSAGPEDCAGDEAHFPGTPGCARVGPPCPAGDWPEDLPADRDVVYVRPDAPAGGDGSLERPFRSITRAAEWVDDDGVVALSKGTFEETAYIGRDVNLWGACAAETVVTWTSPDDLATVVVHGAAVTVKDLTVTGAPGGFFVDARAELTLESVIVRDTPWIGVDVVGGSTVSAAGLVLRDVDVLGLQASEGSAVTLRGAAIERAQGAGLRAFGPGTALVAEDVAVRGTRAAAGDPLSGHAADALGGGRVELARAAIDESVHVGLFADEGSTLVAEDVVVRGTEAGDPRGGDLDTETGSGAMAISSGRVELTRALLSGNRGVGAGAVFEGHLSATDLVVADTRPRIVEGDLGIGLHVAHDGVVTLERVALVRCSESGLSVFLRGTADATDLVVRDTARSPAGLGDADGIGIADEAHVTLTRVEVAGAERVGILVLGTGTTLDASDVTVRDPPADTEPGHGTGIQIQGAEATLSRVAVLRVRVGGLRALGNTARVEASDVTLEEIGSSVPDGRDGEGVLAAQGASVELRRTRVDRARLIGLLAADSGASIVAQDVAVTGTLPEECAETTCTDSASGVGLLAGPGSLEVTRFEVSGAALAGVIVDVEAEVDLRLGVVSGCPIGANVQDESFDLARLQDRVVYVDNGRNLDSSVLPVPHPSWGSL